jgi:hypothetical protein
MARLVIRLVITAALGAFALSGCDDSSSGGRGSGSNDGQVTCTTGGTSYPVGTCRKISGLYMRCGSSGQWTNVQMGGGGAVPPDCY